MAVIPEPGSSSSNDGLAPDNLTGNQPANADSLSAKLSDSHVAVRNDLEISRHVFFGEISYIVRDPVSFEGHRLAPTDYEIFTSLEDSKSLAEVFDSIVERGVAEPEQREEFYEFVVELQKRSLLNLPITDSESLYQNFERRRQSRTKNLLMKLLFLKVPLGSPDRFLNSTFHLVQFVFTRLFFCIWTFGLLAACSVIALNWQEFTSQLASALAIQNLPIMLAVMSLLKLWHEMGHGYACKRFGVSVPSAGMLFMIGTPLAFVDASGSWSLPRRRDRQVINLAGIYFEMMIAILAALVWGFAEGAWIKSVAHFTLLVSSITTIGFNINPLMKYDGYFVLADWLGVPNLKTRSSTAVESCAKRIFFGLRQTAHESRPLRWILVAYGLAAAVYKLLLVVAISMMIATKIWIVGLAIGGYYLLKSFGSMLWKMSRFLWCSPELESRRPLANAYLSMLAIGVPVALLYCPVPMRVQARGVAEHEVVRVIHLQDGGFVKRVDVQPGQRVKQNQSLVEIENIQSQSDWRQKTAELGKLTLRYRGQHGIDNVSSGQAAQAIDRLSYELRRATVKARPVEIVAPIDGQILSCESSKQLGNFLEPGEELIRIGSGEWLVKAVATAKSLADVKPQPGHTVHCRFYSDPKQIYRGTITEVSAAGSRTVRHQALTHLAGGLIPVDPETDSATEPFFELSIRLTDSEQLCFLKSGTVCEIRFQRSYESLGTMALRAILRFVNKVHLK